MIFPLLATGCGDDNPGDQAAQPGAAIPTVLAQTGSDQSPTFTGYNLVTVELAQVPSTVDLGGTVVPRRVVTLSAKAPGRVVYLVGGEGTRVRPLQLLVGLDDDAMLAKRRAAWAGLAKAMAALQNAHVQLYKQAYSPDRSPQGMGVMQMFDRAFTAPAANVSGLSRSNRRAERYAEFNQLRTGVEQAQAGVMQAQAQLDELDSHLRDKKIIAPGPAVILEKFIESGDTVQPGRPLLKVADADNLQIRINVPAGLVRGLAEGMMVNARLDATGDDIEVMLEQIFPAADPVQHTVAVKLALPPGAPAAPGMYATVTMPDLSRAAPSLPVIPATALVWRGSQPSVFLVTADNRTELRLVRVGEHLGNSVVILSGLHPGQRILATPPASMSSRDSVTPGPAGQAPST